MEACQVIGKEKQCGCSGIRSCLLCEDAGDQSGDASNVRDALSVTCTALNFTQCRLCGKFLKKEAQEHVTQCPIPAPSGVCRLIVQESLSLGALPEGVTFEGVTMIQNFVSTDEEKELIAVIDQQHWVESQSGRRKQDYGPKVNFKGRKVKLGLFNGLPAFSLSLVTKMKQKVMELADFVPVELCNLDYHPERGASIDPHFDDSWLWGERLVTLNLLSNTYLTFSLPKASSCDLASNSSSPNTQIEVYMPRGSLVIVAGSARYQWHHSIQREHVTSRRVAVTLRELSREFLPGGSSYIPTGKSILERAAVFTGQQTNSVVRT